MDNRVLGDISNLYVEMQEDLDVEQICADIIMEISLDMLSKGKTKDDVIEFVTSGDADSILEMFSSLPLNEDINVIKYFDELVYISEGIPVKAFLGAIKNAGRVFRGGAAKTTTKSATNAANILRPAERIRQTKRALNQKLLPAAKGTKPANIPSSTASTSTSAIVPAAASKAGKPGILGKVKNFFTKLGKGGGKGGFMKNLAAAGIGFGAGYLAGGSNGSGELPKMEPDGSISSAQPAPSAPTPKPVIADYSKVFPKGVPDYTGIFKDTKTKDVQQDIPKVEVPSDEEKKKAKTELLPDRAPSQLGDKTPYSKAATEKMSLRTRRILSGQSVYNRDPRARAGYDPRYDRKVEMEAYDIVLDYLLSEGHVDTVEEAHYVMMQMDAEYIQSIIA